jgi:hypothetical protein
MIPHRRHFGIFQPAQCRRPAVWRVEHTIAVLLVAVVALLLIAWHNNRTYAAGLTPAGALCWQIESPDLEGYTPAHLIERDILTGMRHQFAPSLQCTGEINGRQITWTATQPWIARGPIAGGDGSGD